MTSYIYLVELDDGVFDKNGVNAHMVVANNAKGAIDICVDNARPEDIDLWYDAEVAMVCETPACINERGAQVILTDRAWR